MNEDDCLMLNEQSTFSPLETIQKGNFTPAYEQISEQTDGLPRDGWMLHKGIHLCLAR